MIALAHLSRTDENAVWIHTLFGLYGRLNSDLIEPIESQIALTRPREIGQIEYLNNSQYGTSNSQDKP